MEYVLLLSTWMNLGGVGWLASGIGLLGALSPLLFQLCFAAGNAWCSASCIRLTVRGMFLLATMCLEASLAILIETPACAAVGAVQGRACGTTVGPSLNSLYG